MWKLIKQKSFKISSIGKEIFFPGLNFKYFYDKSLWKDLFQLTNQIQYNPLFCCDLYLRLARALYSRDFDNMMRRLRWVSMLSLHQPRSAQFNWAEEFADTRAKSQLSVSAQQLSFELIIEPIWFERKLGYDAIMNWRKAKEFDTLRGFIRQYGSKILGKF